MFGFRQPRALGREDWFSANAWQFKNNLSRYAGKPCSILEIGSHAGLSANWILRNAATSDDARLTCIDIEVHADFARNIAASGGTARVTMIPGLSRDVLRGLPVDSFDAVYIDGSHSTVDVLEDAVLSFRLLKIGGVMGFDDYRWNDKRFSQAGVPKPAIDAFLNIYAKKIAVRSRNYQVWLTKVSN